MKIFYEQILASFKKKPEPYVFYDTAYGARTPKTIARIQLEEINDIIPIESYLDVMYGSIDYMKLCYGEDY